MLQVRFFRSFNFDHYRKANEKSKERPWEQVEGTWFPFVRIDLDREVTAVVGANESGKSQLIEAIEMALTGEDIDRRDFCRYSRLYSVETDLMRAPDFGIEFELTTDEDRDLVASAEIGISGHTRLTLFRMNGGEETFLVTPNHEQHELGAPELEQLQARFPKPFTLETDLALPDRLSLDALLDEPIGPLGNRKRRNELIDYLRKLPEDNRSQAIQENSTHIADLVGQEVPEESELSFLKSIELGQKLLFDVATISQDAIRDLRDALQEGDEGRASGLLEQMNKVLVRQLNFNRWWTQDRDFQLRLAPREREIVFTIKDRTGTEYSFKERSRGLSYFLSYYIQLRAHRLQRSERPELLLMDEPDAYLSSSGQQDLLRTLEDFARPDGEITGDQVVYVTHSPFLINKNAGHRIRVLDKGSDEEGTRVVRDAARNGYEPLRTSLGRDVAETAFIGGTNLLVEGLSDQVLLAGMTSILRGPKTSDTELLNLNKVTIIPGDGASSVPYMAYLARGRDEVKPPCVALLDGDKEGKKAIANLKKGRNGKQVMPMDYVVDLAEFATEAQFNPNAGVSVVELEDLIPKEIAAEAARRYAMRMLGISEEEASALTDAKLAEQLASHSMSKALSKAFGQTFKSGHIDKVGFAKEVIYLAEEAKSGEQSPAGMPALEETFGGLIGRLTTLLDSAKRDEDESKVNRTTDRLIQLFIRDYPTGSTRDEAREMFEAIRSRLDNSVGDDAVRAVLMKMQQNHALATDPHDPVSDFSQFLGELDDIPGIRQKAFQEAAKLKQASQPPKPATTKKTNTAAPKS